MENKLDHIGWLTDDIEATISSMEFLGYVQTPIVDDYTQQCRICFVNKPGEVRIELVEPYENNKTMQKMIKKQGCGPYHTCHIVENIDYAYSEMVDNGYIPLFNPVPAPAFNGRRICYFIKQEIGYIELVESK